MLGSTQDQPIVIARSPTAMLIREVCRQTQQNSALRSVAGGTRYLNGILKIATGVILQALVTMF